MSDSPISGLPPASAFTDDLLLAIAQGGLSLKLAGSLLRAAWGEDYLGSTFLPASAHETDVVTLACNGVPTTRKRLWIDVIITFYTGTPDPTGDIGSLRFNGDAAILPGHYWSRHLQYAGSNLWDDSQATETNLIRLAGSNSRLSRNVTIAINNILNRSKTCNIKNQTGTNDAAVAGTINIAGGEWVVTDQQITSVQLVNAGSNNLGTGSGFVVRGRDL